MTDNEISYYEQFRSPIDGKFHYLYKITNLINNKYYYGIHSTKNIDDGYMGSGKSLFNAFKKYKKCNFRKDIIEYFNDRCSLLNREAEVVNERLTKDPDCYNIVVGGAGNIDSGLLLYIDENNNVVKLHKEDYDNKKYKHINSLKRWVTKNGINKSITVDELDHYLNNGWVRGKTVKNESSVQNTIWIHKNGNIKRVYENELMKYYSDGWEKGYGVQANINKHWINKDGINKIIKSDLLQEYLDNGWCCGKKDKIDFERIVVNKNGENKFINKDELDSYILNGWIKGKIFKKNNIGSTGMRWVTNGKENRFVKRTEYNYLINNGWKHGKTNLK